MSGNGQNVPLGWVAATIDDIFAPLEDGRTLHQGWSPQCEDAPSGSEVDWGVLKTTAIQAGVFLQEHNKQLPAHLSPRPLIKVHAGDILITCAGPRSRCGIACLIRHTRRHLMMSGKMYRFRVPEEHIDRRFSVIQAAQAVVETNLKRAERLRQAILKHAFEGKLVPQDPSDEPASVLLVRIREERAAQPTAQRPRRGTARPRKSRQPTPVPSPQQAESLPEVVA